MLVIFLNGRNDQHWLADIRIRERLDASPRGIERCVVDGVLHLDRQLDGSSLRTDIDLFNDMHVTSEARPHLVGACTSFRTMRCHCITLLWNGCGPKEKGAEGLRSIWLEAGGRDLAGMVNLEGIKMKELNSAKFQLDRDRRQVDFGGSRYSTV